MTLARACAPLLRKYLSNHCRRSARDLEGMQDGHRVESKKSRKLPQLPRLRTASVRVGAYFFSSFPLQTTTLQSVPKSSKIPSQPGCILEILEWACSFCHNHDFLGFSVLPDSHDSHDSPIFQLRQVHQVLVGRFQTGTIELHCSSRHDVPWKNRCIH